MEIIVSPDLMWAFATFYERGAGIVGATRWSLLPGFTEDG